MSAIEDIYNGQFNFAEKIKPMTEAYREARLETVKLSDQLEKMLSPNQRTVLGAYLSAHAIVSDEMQKESFRQGMILGAKLERELHPDNAAQNLEDAADNESVG